MSDSPPGLDLTRLAGYLDERLPGRFTGALRAELIAGGRSNLTYRVGDGDTWAVVRRPPLGHVLATAHDMTREFRVISALSGTGVPVPEALVLCEDPEVLGAPFYLMSLVEGQVLRSAEQTAGLDDAQRARLAERLVDCLADLHGIDPDSVGLGDFGRPTGYLARQVWRWSEQLERSRSRQIDGIEALRDGLAGSVPTSASTAILHGDYRLDNVILRPAADSVILRPAAEDTDLRIAAVLDWEMATLGDPLADLGLLVVYWDGLSGLDNPVASGVGSAAGFPPGRVLVRRYAERTGADVTGLSWYVALGFFKLAVVLEGIHYRWQAGQTVGAGFERIGSAVAPLVRAGLATLEEG